MLAKQLASAGTPAVRDRDVAERESLLQALEEERRHMQHMRVQVRHAPFLTSSAVDTRHETPHHPRVPSNTE